jgi:hypothetical protein
MIGVVGQDQDYSSFIEPAEAGSLDRRNVYEHVLAAALRLDEAVRASVRHSAD